MDTQGLAPQRNTSISSSSDSSFTTLNSCQDESHVSKASKRQKLFARLSVRRDKYKQKVLQKRQENMLTMADFYNRQEEFKLWMFEQKGKCTKSMSNNEQKQQFKKFIKLWNKRKLAQKYLLGPMTPPSHNSARFSFIDAQQLNTPDLLDFRETIDLSSNCTPASAMSTFGKPVMRPTADANSTRTPLQNLSNTPLSGEGAPIRGNLSVLRRTMFETMLIRSPVNKHETQLKQNREAAVISDQETQWKDLQLSDGDHREASFESAGIVELEDMDHSPYSHMKNELKNDRSLQDFEKVVVEKETKDHIQVLDQSHSPYSGMRPCFSSGGGSADDSIRDITVDPNNKPTKILVEVSQEGDDGENIDEVASYVCPSQQPIPNVIQNDEDISSHCSNANGKCPLSEENGGTTSFDAESNQNRLSGSLHSGSGVEDRVENPTLSEHISRSPIIDGKTGFEDNSSHIRREDGASHSHEDISCLEEPAREQITHDIDVPVGSEEIFAGTTLASGYKRKVEGESSKLENCGEFCGEKTVSPHSTDKKRCMTHLETSDLLDVGKIHSEQHNIHPSEVSTVTPSLAVMTSGSTIPLIDPLVPGESVDHRGPIEAIKSNYIPDHKSCDICIMEDPEKAQILSRDAEDAEKHANGLAESKEQDDSEMQRSSVTSDTQWIVNTASPTLI